MELGIIERIGDRYEVSEDYRLYWRNLVVGLGEVEEYFLRGYWDLRIEGLIKVYFLV